MGRAGNSNIQTRTTIQVFKDEISEMIYKQNF